MLLICKTPPPIDFSVYANQQGATFKNMPGSVKHVLKDCLLKEQYHLCAYCSKKIENNSMKVEHYLSQTEYPGEQLEYNNLLAVCEGNEGKREEYQTCDTRKGKAKLKRVNPLKIGSLSQIEYCSWTGEIFSKLPDYDKELNNVLNLNCEATYLKTNRKVVWNGVKRRLLGKGDWTTKIVKQEIARLKGINMSYCDMAIWKLEQKL